jgi:hypothetical protein
MDKDMDLGIDLFLRGDGIVDMAERSFFETGFTEGGVSHVDIWSNIERN